MLPVVGSTGALLTVVDLDGILPPGARIRDPLVPDEDGASIPRASGITSSIRDIVSRQCRLFAMLTRLNPNKPYCSRLETLLLWLHGSNPARQ